MQETTLALTSIGSACCALGVPQVVIDSAKNASGGLLGGLLGQYKYSQPRIGEGMEKKIQGKAVSIHFGTIVSDTQPLKFFDINHCYLVFRFSTGEWVRVEVSRYKDGVAVFINQVGLNTYEKSEEIPIEKDKIVSLKHILCTCLNYSKDKKYDIKNENCFHFAQQILLEYGEWGYQKSQMWREIEEAKFSFDGFWNGCKKGIYSLFSNDKQK